MKKRVMFQFLAVMMIVALLTGCGQKEEAGGTTVNEQKEVKELVVAVTKANNSFDPAAPPDTNDTIGRNQVFDTLVTKDNNGEIISWVAENYEVSPDAIVFTFHIKKGIKFSNGLELKASDAKFSLERAMNAASTKTYFSNVASIDVVDDYTIKIDLKSPNVAFLETLTAYGQMLSEETVNKYGDQFGKTVESTVGTGPYILKEWKPNELCVFEANPNYFNGEPGIKRVSFKTIGDLNSAVIALQTGEVGLCLSPIPTVAVDSVEKNDKLILTSYPSVKMFYIYMNCQTGPFTDVRLRQAVAYAVDRQKLLMVGSEGRGIAVDYPGGPDFTGNPNIKTWYNMDIEKAKQLVKEAGMEGKTITVSCESISPLSALATSLQNDLSKMGLKVEVQQMEMNAFLKDVFADGKYDMAVSYTSSATRDMDTLWSKLYLSSNIGATNAARYSNPEMDKLIMEGRGATNTEERKQIYAEAAKLWTNDVPSIVMYYEFSSHAYSKDLEIDKGYVQYDKLYYYKWKE